MELISVIVPVYNVEKYLERCVFSILKQTYTELEVILVNDGSTDESGIICDKLKNKDSRIMVLHKENGGQATARNMGIKVCKGEWICFIDSDDFIREDYIEELHRLCKTYNVPISQCGAIRGTASKFPDEDVEVKEVKWNFKDMYTSSLRVFRAVVWGKLIKAELAKKYPFPEGKIYEDEGPSFKYMYDGKECVVTNKHMYYYYMSSNSTLRNKSKTVRFDVVEIFEDRLQFLYERNEYDLISHTEKELCIRLMLSYCNAIKDEKDKEDIKKLKKSYIDHYHNINWKIHSQIKEVVALRIFYLLPRTVAFIENNFGIIKKHKLRREKK